MTKSQLLLAPAVIASAFALCAPAQATTFTGSGSVNIVGGSGAFYDSMIPTGNFTDTIDFTTPTTGIADVGVIYFKVVKGISNLSASFNGNAITFTQLAPNLFAGGISLPVGPGPQQISVSGFSGGLGSYSGNVVFTSAVPEIATWLMMIAGVGFTGLALRRRRTAYKVNYAF